MKSSSIAPAALCLYLVAPSFTFACSTCGSFVSSDWASQGYTADGGLRFDARYDYFNQNELRTGTRRFDRGNAIIPNDREIQQSTINRNLALGVDFSPNSNWGVNAQLPVLDRPHTTIAPGDTDISTSRSREIGDVRVLGRYQGLNSDGSVGIQFGLKLPTGRINYNFSKGPQAGTPLDRGLQPGTGTADALLGAYHFGTLGDELSYFGNILIQLPLDSKDHFRPGKSLNINAGIRYQTDSGIAPQLQINLRKELRESGVNADVENSGATLLYLSPGITIPVGKDVQGYGYIQVPVFQRVNGLQLEPHYTLSVGLRWTM